MPLSCDGKRQRIDGKLPLRAQAQWFPAGDEHDESRRGVQQMLDLGSGVAEVLEVVQQEQGLARA